MPTGTLGTVARKFQTDQVHYLSVPINGVLGAQTVTIGKIPAGASVIDAGFHVVVALNGTGTVAIGVAGTTTGLAGALVATTIGVIKSAALPTSTIAYFSADTDVIATVGGTPTLGSGYAFVTYIMSNRGA